MFPIDEIYLKRKDTDQPKQQSTKPKPPEQASIKSMLWKAVGIVAGLILLLLLLPLLILVYYKIRYQKSKTEGDQAYWAFMAANYYLHLIGMPRGKQTPMQYAREVVDPKLGTTFTGFMNIYLKKKYAKQSLTEQEKGYVSNFLQPFLQTVGKKIPLKQKVLGFMNPIRCAGFFTLPQEEDEIV